MFDDSLVSYTLEVDYDITPVEGNAMCSGDDDFDRQIEDEIYARLNDGDVWAWANVTVRATYDGVDSVVGMDNLGGCCYKDEEDFRACSYFADMKAEAREDLYMQIEGILARFGCVNPNEEEI